MSSLLCADSMFGLHPAMAPLAAAVAAPASSPPSRPTGLRVANRSHFSAIEEVEDAAPGSDARTGWINRMIGLGSTPAARSTPYSSA